MIPGVNKDEFKLNKTRGEIGVQKISQFVDSGWNWGESFVFLGQKGYEVVKLRLVKLIFLG